VLRGAAPCEDDGSKGIPFDVKEMTADSDPSTEAWRLDGFCVPNEKYRGSKKRGAKK
jgi:hypothetical protein